MKGIARSRVLSVSLGVLLILFSLAVVEAGNSALDFGGSTAPAQIGVAPLVTTATDDMWMDVWLKWTGPAGTNSSLQTPIYNGNSGCSGWGITLLDATGQVGILVGGVAVETSNAFLTPGEWQHIRASRHGGIFQLKVDGVDYPLSGNPTPNAIGSSSFCASGEATTIGSGSTPVWSADPFYPGSRDPYNGAIDKVRMNVIGSKSKDKLTFWHLDEGSGTTATDIHGAVMTLIGSPAWVSGSSKP